MTYTRKSKKLYATAAALAVTASAVAPGLQASASSATVKSIAAQKTVYHYGGVSYAVKKVTLPSKVKVQLSNGKYEYRSVKWDAVSFNIKYIEKYQTIYGKVAGTSMKAKIKVYLKDYVVDVIEPKLAPVMVGGKLELPKTVVAVMKSGKKVNRTTIVYGKPDTSKPGKFYLDYTLISKNQRLKGKIAYEVKALPAAEGLTVKALSKSKLEVTFKDAVDDVRASNFTIAGARVNGADLSADHKKAILEVHDLEIGKEYTLEIKGVPINGKRTDLGAIKFNSIAAQALWDLKVIPKKSSIIADGATSTEVEFALYDKTTGQIDVNADNLVLEVSSSHGSFSNITKNRITLQNGKANGVLRSEASSKALDVKISAEVMEASGDYKALIGKVLGHGQMKFEPATHSAVRSLTLMKAESNEADRVTLFFDNPVLLSDFIYLDTSGKPIVDHHGRQLLKSGVKLDISQDRHDSDIRGIRLVPGNDKAIEVILEKSSVLKDNKTVDVLAEIPNSAGKILKSNESFKLTDARDPEATAVSVQGLNQLIVRFSEGIADAKFKIDGIFLEGHDFDVKFGEFDARNMLDNRDIATLTLKDGYDDGKHRGYFKAGNHSLQISSVKDFAALSDSANLGTTQTLDFTVHADETKPKATVKVESPEQFRLTFDKILKESAADLRSKLSVEVYDYHGKKWVKADKLRGNFALERVGDTNEYVFELLEDWTRIYDTERTGRNYYNDKYRIVIDKYAVTNTHNGEKNDDIILDLNYAGSPLNDPDVKSAKIKSIDYSGVKDHFVVSMDEPVKLYGKDVDDTPNEDQVRIPMTSVQFIGKDKYGHTVTLSGKVLGYYGDAKDDMKFLVAPDNDSMQRLVDAGGSQDWKIIVKSLSDDVGNTVETLTKDFKVLPTPVKDTPFAIAQDRYGKYLAEGDLDGREKDLVQITFTEGVQHRGGVYDATNVMQYTINGKTLPKGSSVSVKDYDGKPGYETVLIVLPDDTLQRSNNIIAVNQDLVSADGSVLTGAYEVELDMKRR